MCVQLCPTLYNPWTVARQVPLSMGFSKQEYCRGLPFPPPGDLPDSGIEPASPESPAWAGGKARMDVWTPLNSAFEKWKDACGTPIKGRKLITQHMGSAGDGEGNCVQNGMPCPFPDCPLTVHKPTALLADAG